MERHSNWLSVGLACLGLALLGSEASSAAAPAGNQVDLELVLAVDISGSMDLAEQRVQRDGYIQAFRSADVINGIADGLTGRIAVTYVEWAGMDVQKVLVPWTLIDGKDTAYAFADQLGKMPLGTFRGTSISAALEFSASLFDDTPFSAPRRVIDISGDGPNNMGAPVLPVRDSIVAKGITINGLPIMVPGHDASGSRDLDLYYKQCVIGGPDAFLFTISKLDEFPTAIRRKLIQEIAAYPPPRRGVTPVQAPVVNCNSIGGLYYIP